MQIAYSGEGTELRSSSQWYTDLGDAEFPLCQERPYYMVQASGACSETQNLVYLLMSPYPLSWKHRTKHKDCDLWNLSKLDSKHFSKISTTLQKRASDFYDWSLMMKTRLTKAYITEAYIKQYSCLTVIA